MSLEATCSETRANQSHNETRVSDLLSRIAADFTTKPFVPHRIFKQGDAQTIGAHFWPGRWRARDRTRDEERLFEVEPGSQVLARCRWQTNRAEHPALVLWHGMEGSSASGYMLITADKAFRAGFNVIRVNFRNCGNTEHLSPKLYHGGLTSDLRVVIDELIAGDGLSHIAIAGFSLGGNMVLKLAGEYGENPPREIKAVCAVSPSIDMRAGSELLMKRRNWIYQHDFLRRLRQRIRIKKKLFPNLYDSNGLNRVRTIKQFDDRYVAPAFGFENADDYYAKASSFSYISRIRVPTLIIHAEDDPFVPFAPLRDPLVTSNPYVLLIATERGGHVAFLSNTSGEDRFWAENRVVEFCQAIAGSATTSSR
jgi:predicted alpha/beta-fold hydrolase